MNNGQLFDETFMRRLERLSLVTRRVRTGRAKGERRSTKRGSSVEFADYRNYTPGDDLRRLDWRIYARLERPFIKLFEEEEDQSVHLVLDASASMDWPESDRRAQLYGFDRRRPGGAFSAWPGQPPPLGTPPRPEPYSRFAHPSVNPDRRRPD